MRQRIIELILATDMGSHFDSISKFRIRRKSTEFDYLGDVEDFWSEFNVDKTEIPLCKCVCVCVCAFLPTACSSGWFYGCASK